MNGHTIEPWSISHRNERGIEIQGADGDGVCLSHDDGGKADVADALRIVACVNACAGISTESLYAWMNPPEGQLGAPHGTWRKHLFEAGEQLIMLQRQRDELLAAIRNHKQVKGRFHTEQATLDLYRVLEEVEAAE